MRDAIRFLGNLLVRWAGPAKQQAVRESNAEYFARRDARAERKRLEREADMQRLKQLGGVPRSPVEELEFNSLLLRYGHSKAYFESRGWERQAA